MEAMNTVHTIDRAKYRRLASRVVVKAIESGEEHDAMVAAVGRLMQKGEDNLSREESALLETMAILIQAYDEQQYPLVEVSPNEMLATLLETSGRQPKDLLPIFGTRGRISEVLRGKRSISKEQAKKLAAFFSVTVDLFI
jgi:HTH-type transcriptional regulator / antitoxin HigA